MQLDSSSIMNRIFVRETHSLLQYMNDAWPWAAAQEQDALEQLKKIVFYEKEAIRAVGDYLSRHHVAPGLGSFPSEYTEMHFVALDYLLPKLIADQREKIMALENDLVHLSDEEARNLGRELLERKQRHLADLEHLAGQHAWAKSVSTLR